MVYHSNSTIDGLDITNYWQYFNLDCDPFAMNIEAALIYLPTYWEEMLDLIQYVVHYKNQLAVVTGTNGIGKTVLADLLEVQLGESVHCVKIAAEQSMNMMQLLEFLSDAFLVPWQAGDAVEQILDDQLQAFQHKEKNCLLLIDNAQLLPTETLEALLYMVSQQSESQMRFHIVLFGEITLQQTLQRMLEPAEEALVHFLILEPLSLEETEQYLNYRLSAANWQSANPMSEEVVARIYRLSEGNPARINRIARRFLLDLLTEQESSGNGSWFKKHAAQFIGGGLIVIILMALALWIWRSNMVQHVMATKIETVKPMVTVNGQTLPETQVKYVDPAPLNAVKTEEVHASASASEMTVPTAPQTAAVADSVNHKVEVAQVVPTPGVTAEPAPGPTAAPAPEPISVSNVNAAQKPPEAASKVNSDASSQAVPQTEPPVETTALPVSSAANNQNVISAKSAVQPASPAATPISSSAKKEPASEGGGNYTIWLIHLQHSGSFEQFIKDNHLENKIHVVTRHAQGKKIKEITYGSYKTMYDAEQAVATLPPILMSAGPWPKKKDGQ